MSSSLPPEAPGPVAGQPGHFTHHDWLTASVKALDAALERLDAAQKATLEPLGMSVQIPVPAGQKGAQHAVTFPAGRFKATPAVVLQANATATWDAYPASITANGCGVNVFRPDGTAVTTATTVTVWIVAAQG